jgi:predicted DNA-binding transcriptional regulator YafY
MSILKYFERLSYIDYLIRKRSVTSVNDLSDKLKISIRMVHEYLKLMKELGAPVKYSRKLRLYEYEKDMIFRYGFFDVNK